MLHRRETTLGLIRDEGITILEVDSNRGRGQHFLVRCEYKGTPFEIITSPVHDSTQRARLNFRAQLRRKKREIDGPTT